MTHVHHRVAPRRAAVRLALRDLVAVVRELQVDSARVDLPFTPRTSPTFRWSPNSVWQLAEHSMCHPGRPFPHGDSQL